MEPVLYDRLYNLCCSSAFPSELTKAEKDSLRRKSKNFLAKNGLLYYRDRKRNVDLQVMHCSVCGSILLYVCYYWNFYNYTNLTMYTTSGSEIISKTPCTRRMSCKCVRRRAFWKRQDTGEDNRKILLARHC